MRRIWPALLLCLCLCQACGSGEEQDQSLKEARSAFAQGYFLEAEKGFEAYLKLHPKGQHRLEAWNRLVETAVNVKGNTAAGVALLEAMLLEYGADSDQAWLIMTQLGQLLLQANDLDKAVLVLRRRLELPGLDGPRRAVALLELSQALQRQGKFDAARETLQACVHEAGRDQGKADCLYELAQTLYFLRDMDQAKRALEELMALPRSAVSAQTRSHAAFVLADIYEHEREFDKACELLESILDDHPNPRAVRARLGLLK